MVKAALEQQFFFFSFFFFFKSAPKSKQKFCTLVSKIYIKIGDDDEK